MKRNKIISMMLIVVMLLFSPRFEASAETGQMGSIKIELSDGGAGTSKENVIFEYGKVADLENETYRVLERYRGMGIEICDIKTSGEMEKAAYEFDTYVSADGIAKTDKEGKTIISGLSPGMYLLRVSDGALYDKVYPALITVPAWNEVTKNFDYEVVVVPKHIPDNPEKVVTGDRTHYMLYLGLSIISLTLVVGLTCHNRFKCGKIAVNYSEKGGYRHGNDNDTKNPRRTRRTRSRGGRSIN